MCGRYTLARQASELQKTFLLEEFPADWAPRYNIAPGQMVPVVTNEAPCRAQMFRWGLIPFWAKDMEIGWRLINARSETIGEKPAYRAAFQKRRCLILADGFFEWQHPVDKKGKGVPYYFRLTNELPFAFAGLWEIWQSSQGEIFSCTIITTEANDQVRYVHERMPVILLPESYQLWLDPLPPAQHMQLLRPLRSDLMMSYPVTQLVNRADQDIPQCIEPLQ
ncbi:MAG: SOS response-associated peptidase [Anaerolineae bacterium]|nr:SOS response-associated peptidase [Anaerolineae bacterium]